MKKCKTCGEWLVANNYNFSKNKDGKWGLRSKCKKCDKKWRGNNKEYSKEYSKEWNKNNEEYIKKHKKQYYKDNKEYIKLMLSHIMLKEILSYYKTILKVLKWN